LDKKKTVLIIDDDLHIRRVLEIKLKNNGYRPIVAKNGQEGLELLNREKPDAVISDINMPKLDGKAFCLQTNPIKEKRPFLTIVITARINPDEQVWINDLKDTLFMEKPFSPSKIVDSLDEYFNGPEPG